MPAVVRGGRRQAKPAPEQKSAPAKTARSAGSGSAAPKGRKGAAPQGKYRVIGSVPVPNEVVAWFAVLSIAGMLSAVLMTGGRGAALGHAVTSFADDRIAGFGLALKTVKVVGASPEVEPTVRKAITDELRRNHPDVEADFAADRLPLALMDITAMQQAVEKVGWVKQASIRRQFPNLLVVTVVERPRLAVWQYRGKDSVIDDQGQVIPEARAVNFLNLPLVVGEGANETAGDILQLMQTRPVLMQKTYALQRVDTRRWNILLKNGVVIKLPAQNQEQALRTLDGLMVQQRVLDQGLAEIDLLDPNALQVVPIQAHNAQPAT